MAATSATPLWDLAGIATQTGLSPRSVRNYVDKFKEELRPFRKQGANAGQVYFNEDGLALFQRIKALRFKGLVIPEIREVLAQERPATAAEATPGNLPWQTPEEPPANPATAAVATQAIPGNTSAADFVDHLKEQLQQSLQREEALAAQLATANATLLTQERGFRDEQKDLLLKLADNEAKIERQSAVLLQLTQGLSLKDYQEHVQTTALQREQLLADLQKLNGKWFKGKQRKALLKALAQLG